MGQAMHTARMAPFSTLNNVSTAILYLKPLFQWYSVSESPKYLQIQIPLFDNLKHEIQLNN
jgi:hypothetical protein